MILDRDLRTIERPFLAEEQMLFPYERGRVGYVVATTEYAYGIIGRAVGFSGRLDLWIPGRLAIVPERVLARDDFSMPDLSHQDPDKYRWIEDLRVSRSEGRSRTYVGKDLLEYEEIENGFGLTAASQYPVKVYSLRPGEPFLRAVLNRRPRK